MSDKPTTEERLAALRQRQKVRPRPDSPLDPPTPGPQAREARRRRSPATTARYVTVGASTTAVVGLMGAFGGLAASAETNAESSATVDPSVGWSATSENSQSIAVNADAPVVMVVVNSNGMPIELRSIESAQHLAAMLRSGQPIIEPVVTPSSQVRIAIESPGNLSAVTEPIQLAATEATQSPMQTDTPATPSTPAAAPTSSTAPRNTTTLQPSPPSTPAPTPETTVGQTPLPAQAPETTVPVAQPAPVELKLPTPAPSQGNSGGS